MSNPNSGTWAEPANDNVELTKEGFRPGVEAELEQRPSPEELERAWKEGGTEAARRLRRKDSFGTPKGPDDLIREDRDTKARAQKKLAIDALKYLLAYVRGEPIEAAELPDEHWRHIPTPAPENVHKLAARELLEEFGVSRDVPFEEARKRCNLPPVANDNSPAYPWRPADPREYSTRGECAAIRFQQRAASLTMV